MNFDDFYVIFHTLMQDNGFSDFADEAHSRMFYLLTEHLLEESQKMNLTAIREERAMILRHYADSLTVARFLPKGATIADIGCGAGFPCLPLAICRPDLQITAIDSTEKRIRYVNETAKLLSLPGVQGFAMRAEEGSHGTYREKYDVALARAVAELPLLSELCLPFVRPGGTFLAMKASRTEEELALSQRGIRKLGGGEIAIHELLLRDGEETLTRTIVEVKKLHPTPKELPRAFARMRKSPL